MATAIKDKVLLIEDDLGICQFVHTVLTANSYDVILAHSVAEARPLIASHCPELILLDLGLPDTDGMALIRSVREWSAIPIIVVSARTEEQDKIAALDLGADDYITKPFGTGELLARMRTALRHTRLRMPSSDEAQTGVFCTGGLVINYDRHQVTVEGQLVHLTQNEYKIVALLGQYAGQVQTYKNIIKALWGPSAGNDNQILRVNMANIRRKIEKNPADPRYIRTEIGIGYRMADETIDCDIS